jgi:hypothetical protein
VPARGGLRTVTHTRGGLRTVTHKCVARIHIQLLNEEVVFISIHIPKTAGTVLGYLFDHGSGRKVLWDYAPDYSNARRIDPMWLEHIEFIQQRFWGIHGHFFYQKYSDIFPDSRFITSIRHPVKRLESQFRHELYDAMCESESWRAEALREGSLPFLEFVRSDENTRLAQSIHLAGRDILDYDFVFVTEMLPSCMEAFSRKFNFRRRDSQSDVGIPWINDMKPRVFEDSRKQARFEKLSFISDEDRRNVFMIIPEEVELYRRGYGYAERLIKQ